MPKEAVFANKPEMYMALAWGTPAEQRRVRLIEAVTRTVAKKGYPATTVSDIVKAARLSRTTFYEEFDGKEACFLEAYRAGVRILADTVHQGVHSAEAGWRNQLRAGIRAYLELLASNPQFARTYVIEVQHAGPKALAARQDAMRRFAARYRASFEQARQEKPNLREPHPDALLVLCAGTEQLIAERVRAGKTSDLPDLEDVFCDCAEAVLLRPAEKNKKG